MKIYSFQSIVLALQSFWAEKGCLLVQPHSLEMGAGTSHPLTALAALGPHPWRVAFVQTCHRPADGRYGENPNRLQRFYQFQVIMKPPPFNIQALLLESYGDLGLDLKAHDIRFVEDDWENPSLGASGLGWEVWLDGMEITQFTYFQQMGGIECSVVSAELAYGLDRIALCLQDKDSVFDLAWNDPDQPESVTYGQMHQLAEQQFCAWHFEHAPLEGMMRHFEEALAWGRELVEKGLILPAYDQCIQANHLLNRMEARGGMGAAHRGEGIAKVRQLANACCQQWVDRHV